MTTKTDGGSAFPHEQGLLNPGMSLRDYFAAKAMQVILSSPERVEKTMKYFGIEHQPVDKWIARSAYHLADAMLKAREEE